MWFFLHFRRAITLHLRGSVNYANSKIQRIPANFAGILWIRWLRNIWGGAQYVYCLNNPVNAINPDGRIVIASYNKKNWQIG